MVNAAISGCHISKQFPYTVLWVRNFISWCQEGRDDCKLRTCFVLLVLLLESIIQKAGQTRLTRYVMGKIRNKSTTRY